MSVELGVIPHEQSHLLVIGSTVRKSATIVGAWLQSLQWQVTPRGVQRFFLFINDGCDAETLALLQKFTNDHGGMVWDAEPAPQGDFGDTGGTHEWTTSAMARVGRSKDRLLDFARVNRAEAIWLVDSDLILDPMTLTSLWSVPCPITASVYWTRWMRLPDPEHPPVHAGPQVWLAHPYSLHGNGLEEWEFRQQLVERQLVKVFGLGACTLIRRDALMKGVSFAPWPGNNMPGIGQGEDRMFCLRAEALHLEMKADPWPDVFHVYHTPEDVEQIPDMVARLDRYSDVTNPYQHQAKLGDLISLELCALEPVPTHQGQMYPPPQLVRGRLGKLALHPELEQAVLEMERGEQRIVPVHFPLSWPFPPHRGQRKLIRLTLIDHKSFGFAPVIETEIIKNDIGGYLDSTQQTPSNIGLLREIHAA